MSEIAVEIDDNVCITNSDSFGDEWTIIPRTSWRYWWYRFVIWRGGARGWWWFIRAAIKNRGWRRGIEYVCVVIDVCWGRPYDSIDWRRFGIYTEKQAMQAGICPPSILDIDIEDEKWEDAIV